MAALWGRVLEKSTQQGAGEEHPFLHTGMECSCGKFLKSGWLDVYSGALYFCTYNWFCCRNFIKLIAFVVELRPRVVTGNTLTVSTSVLPGGTGGRLLLTTPGVRQSLGHKRSHRPGRPLAQHQTLQCEDRMFHLLMFLMKLISCTWMKPPMWTLQYPNVLNNSRSCMLQ